MAMTQVLGWGSAVLLVATISTQVGRQYRERAIAGVSPWLYVGQACASAGLAVYSVLLGSWVFVALNIIMATIAVVGLGLWFRLRAQRDAES